MAETREGDVGETSSGVKVGGPVGGGGNLSPPLGYSYRHAA